MAKIDFDKNFPVAGVVRMTKLNNGITLVTSRGENGGYDTVVAYNFSQKDWELLATYKTVKLAQIGHRIILDKIKRNSREDKQNGNNI